MASSELIEFATLIFKPALQPPPGTSDPPAAFRDLCTQLHAVPGVSAIYMGQQIEKPDRWTWVVRWANAEALDAFIASAVFSDWTASFRANLEAFIIHRGVPTGNTIGALEAPCTELFLGQGVVDGFVAKNAKTFITALEAGNLKGFHGSSYGDCQPMAKHGMEPHQGNSAVAFLGWDSLETHVGHTGEGTLIGKHLPAVIEGLTAPDVHHVKLAQL